MAKKAEIPIILSNGKQAGETINELRQQANRLNKEINNLKPGSEEFVKKSKDFNKITGRLKEVRTEVTNTRESNDKLVQSFSQFVPFSGQINSVRNAIQGVNLGLKGTRAALIATGIGAFIVVLGSLISYLTTVQEGIDKVTAVTRPLKAIFETMKGVVQELGGSVFKGLAMILNGDIKEGLKTLGQGFVDVISNTREAIEQGIEAGTRLDQLQKMIERNEIELIKRREQLKLISKQANDVAEDETATLKQREEAAKRAINAQIELEQLELDFIDLKIEKMKLEHTLNETSREEEKALAELEAERFRKSTEIQEARTTLRNKLNIIRKAELAQQQKEQAEADKIEAERLKKLEAERQAQAVRELEAFRNIQNLKIALMEEGLQKEIEKIWLDTDRKIEAVTGSEAQITEQKRLLEDQRLQQIEAVQLKYHEAEEARKDALIKKEKERQAQAAQTAIAVATGTAGALGGIFGNLAGLQEEGSENYKTFAQIQARMSAFQAAINAYQSTVAIPIVGPALAPIAAATALAFGMKQADNIGRQNPGTPSGGGGTGSVGASFNPTASAGGINLTAAATPPQVTTSTTRTPTAANDLIGNTTTSANDNTERMIQAFENRISKIKVVNDVQETKNGIDVLNQLESNANT